MLRKLLIVIIISFIGNTNIFVEVLLGFGVILLSISMQLNGKPFDSPLLNNLELKSLISAGILSFSSLYFSQTGYPFLDLVIIAFCGFGNIYFLSYWSWEFYKIIREELKETIKGWIKAYNTLITKLETKIKCFKIFHYKNSSFQRVLSTGIGSISKDYSDKKLKSKENISDNSSEISKFNRSLEENSLINSTGLFNINKENFHVKEKKDITNKLPKRSKSSEGIFFEKEEDDFFQKFLDELNHPIIRNSEFEKEKSIINDKETIDDEQKIIDNSFKPILSNVNEQS